MSFVTTLAICVGGGIAASGTVWAFDNNGPIVLTFALTTVAALIFSKREAP